MRWSHGLLLCGFWDCFHGLDQQAIGCLILFTDADGWLLSILIPSNGLPKPSCRLSLPPMCCNRCLTTPTLLLQKLCSVAYGNVSLIIYGYISGFIILILVVFEALLPYLHYQVKSDESFPL